MNPFRAHSVRLMATLPKCDSCKPFLVYDLQNFRSRRAATGCAGQQTRQERNACTRPSSTSRRGFRIAANGAWVGVQQPEQDQPAPVVHPEVVGQAAAEILREDQAAARLAARDRFALPGVHPRGAPGDSRRQEGRQRPPQREGRRDQGDHPRARRQDPDGQGLPAPRPLRGRDGDGHGVLQAPRRRVPGPRHPRPQRREAPQPRQQHDSARPRLGADGRPDQPLQHDVRPLLHGREPGRVRPRAVVGRHQDGAGQRDQHQAAASDVGAVLRRRADDFAVLPRRGPLRAQGRLQQRPGGDQRHRVRQASGVREGSGGSRSPLRVSAVRRHRQRRQRAPPRRQPVRRQAARDRKPAQQRRRHRAGRDHRQRRQQRAGRPDHRVRARQSQDDQLPVVPAGVVHRPRRGSDAGAPRRAALHAVAPRARREEPDRHRRAGPRLVPDFVHGQLHRLGRRDPRRREGIRSAHLRLPPELRRRHGDHDRQGNQGSGAGHGVPQGRAVRQGRRSRSPTPAAAASGRTSAWRSPSSATTTRSSRRPTSS